MTDLFNTIVASARFSEDGNYRYVLTRQWNNHRTALLIMLNPSLAGTKNDPTIRSCKRLLNHHGFGGFFVINLFALITPNPINLDNAIDPIGPENDYEIEYQAKKHRNIICAWGAHRIAHKRLEYISDVLKDKQPLCFGVTKAGAPKHPLYVKTGTPLQDFNLKDGLWASFISVKN